MCVLSCFVSFCLYCLLSLPSGRGSSSPLLFLSPFLSLTLFFLCLLLVLSFFFLSFSIFPSFPLFSLSLAFISLIYFDFFLPYFYPLSLSTDTHTQFSFPALSTCHCSPKSGKGLPGSCLPWQGAALRAGLDRCRHPRSSCQ